MKKKAMEEKITDINIVLYKTRFLIIYLNYWRKKCFIYSLCKIY